MTPHAVTRAATVGAALAACLLVAVTLAVYWPGLGAGFSGDDFMILHRLRLMQGASDALRFFDGEFFGYYRPLGFVTHAVDYAQAGPASARFHFTNLLLHTLNALLVLSIGRRLSPGTLAGPVAAALFALHASNHEAVMWVSARFDLLATTFSLAALAWWTGRDQSRAMPAFLFLLALLSKESAVALPIAAAGWLVFCRKADVATLVRRAAPWLVALGLYAVMRQVGGGVSGIGGASRMPKLLALVCALVALGMMAGGRWRATRDAVVPRRGAAAVAAGLALAVAGLAAAAGGPIGRLAADKLAVAGFEVVHLAAPVADVFERPFYLEPATAAYWLGGLVSAALAAVVILALWRALVGDDRMWFLASLLVATLLPISALTEGKRYLYLPSAAVSLIAGVLIAEAAKGRRRQAAFAITGVFLAISTADIARKVRDWTWAGRMTADGARLADAALAPRCGEGSVVFLTSPVGVRGVYTHFYYETFELPRGCMPAVFQVLARMVRIDGSPDVSWDGPDRIAIRFDPYRGNVVLSEDLRDFTRPLREGDTQTLETPLGQVRAAPTGERGMQLTLTLSETAKKDPPMFFYYSGGRIHALEAPGVGRTAQGVGLRDP